jgi:hypothetical protein
VNTLAPKADWNPSRNAVIMNLTRFFFAISLTFAHNLPKKIMTKLVSLLNIDVSRLIDQVFFI